MIEFKDSELTGIIHERVCPREREKERQNPVRRSGSFCQVWNGAARVDCSARRKKFRRIGDRPRGTWTGVLLPCICSRLFLVVVFLHSLC